MEMTDTRTAIMDTAEELLQTRGFNAFSFRDLAERVGIKSASIHYHFPTKMDLCRALIARHRQRVVDALETIDRESGDAPAKLLRYLGIFQSTLETGNRMCPSGMLASESSTLDEAVCTELRESFDDHERWLTKILKEGKKSGDLSFDGSPRQEARLILSTLEGAMLIARTYSDPRRLNIAGRMLLAKLMV